MEWRGLRLVLSYSLPVSLSMARFYLDIFCPHVSPLSFITKLYKSTPGTCAPGSSSSFCCPTPLPTPSDGTSHAFGLQHPQDKDERETSCWGQNPRAQVSLVPVWWPWGSFHTPAPIASRKLLCLLQVREKWSQLKSLISQSPVSK